MSRKGDSGSRVMSNISQVIHGRSQTALGVYAHAFFIAYAATVAPGVLGTAIKLAMGSKVRSPLQKIMTTLQNGLNLTNLPSAMGILVGGIPFLQGRVRPYVARVYKRVFGDADDVRIDMWSTYTAAFISGLVSICLLQSSPEYKPRTPVPVSVPRSQGSVMRATAADLTEGLPGNVPHYMPVPRNPDPTVKPRHMHSPTLDLTLFFFVRAGHCFSQYLNRYVWERSGTGKVGVSSVQDSKAEGPSPESLKQASYSGGFTSRLRDFMRSKGTVLLFVLSSYRVCFAYFYAPWTLPPAYERWIAKVGGVHPRVCQMLRHVRQKHTVYGVGMTEDFVSASLKAAAAGNYDPFVSDPVVHDHIHCFLAHAHSSASPSCLYNAVYHFCRVYKLMFPTYLAVQAVPDIIRRYRDLRKPLTALKLAKRIVLEAMRSALFFATFIVILWYGICFGRTVIPHRLLRGLIDQSHFDGGWAVHLGSMLAGLSMLILPPSRRPEIALYVAPRAIVSVLGDISPAYFMGPSLRPLTKWIERLTFAGSTAYVSLCMFYYPRAVRGILRIVTRFCYGDVTSYGLPSARRARMEDEAREGGKLYNEGEDVSEKHITH